MIQSVSIVVSVFNEAEVIRAFSAELRKKLDGTNNIVQPYEVLFVNDGSFDNSAALLDEIADKWENVRVIHFSRNFGHEAAMLAGIEHASGDAIICMDADLQHTPDSIPAMVEKFTEGYEIITMCRDSRADAGIIKSITSRAFYRLINFLSKNQFQPNASDFFMISKRVAGIISSQYPERTRFLRGLIQSVGFKKTSLTFVAPERVAGQSKYSIIKLFFFSLTAIATFSHIPLRIGVAVGLIFGAFSLIVSIYSIIMKFLGQPFSGYTTLVVLMSLGFSLLFIVIGIIGEYIGYIFSEVKKRPVYIVDRITLGSTPEESD